MKLASVRVGKKETYGAVVAGGLVDLGKKFGKKWPTLRLALLGGGLAKLKAYAKGRKPDIKDGKFAWMPVIPDTLRIFCAGVNYREHRAETGRPDTAHPTIFTRFAYTQIGHEQPMLKPKESERLDWEGELAIVIGKKGRRIARASAMSHVAGYACYNDGSVRDYQRHTSQFTPGKNFVGTGGFGLSRAPAAPAGPLYQGTEEERAENDARLALQEEVVALLRAKSTAKPSAVAATTSKAEDIDINLLDAILSSSERGVMNEEDALNLL